MKVFCVFVGLLVVVVLDVVIWICGCAFGAGQAVKKLSEKGWKFIPPDKENADGDD